MLHEELMRGGSPFSVAERELIAAYVSGLNACSYCHGVHAATAHQFGVSEDLLTLLLQDIERAPIDAKMKPVLRLVEKLTRMPAKVDEADARAVFEAGWNEQALHDAVAVCALFNYMNRLVEGLGISAGPAYFQLAGERLAAIGYAGLARMLEDE